MRSSKLKNSKKDQIAGPRQSQAEGNNPLNSNFTLLPNYSGVQSQSGLQPQNLETISISSTANSLYSDNKMGSYAENFRVNVKKQKKQKSESTNQSLLNESSQNEACNTDIPVKTEEIREIKAEHAPEENKISNITQRSSAVTFSDTTKTGDESPTKGRKSIRNSKDQGHVFRARLASERRVASILLTANDVKLWR